MRLWFALLAVLVPAAASAKPVPLALTFDDLPAHGPLPPGQTRLSVVNAILRALRQARVNEAYGFVAGSFGADDPQSPLVLRAWRTAGYPLGNHSWSHANLDSVGADWYLGDIDRNESVIAPLMRRADWHWYRYPYLAEGQDPAKRDAVRSGILARGYRIASVTISFDDYAYNEPYARCLAVHDSAGVERLETLYRAGAATTFAATQQRGGGQIVLLHVGAFTAHMLPQLLREYRAAGARFVSLAQATRRIKPKASTPSPNTTPFAELTGICANAG